MSPLAPIAQKRTDMPPDSEAVFAGRPPEEGSAAVTSPFAAPPDWKALVARSDSSAARAMAQIQEIEQELTSPWGQTLTQGLDLLIKSAVGTRRHHSTDEVLRILSNRYERAALRATGEADRGQIRRTARLAIEHGCAPVLDPPPHEDLRWTAVLSGDGGASKERELQEIAGRTVRQRRLLTKGLLLQSAVASVMMVLALVLGLPAPAVAGIASSTLLLAVPLALNRRKWTADDVLSTNRALVALSEQDRHQLELREELDRRQGLQSGRASDFLSVPRTGREGRMATVAVIRLQQLIDSRAWRDTDSGAHGQPLMAASHALFSPGVEAVLLTERFADLEAMRREVDALADDDVTGTHRQALLRDIEVLYQSLCRRVAALHHWIGLVEQLSEELVELDRVRTAAQLSRRAVDMAKLLGDDEVAVSGYAALSAQTEAALFQTRALAQLVGASLD